MQEFKNDSWLPLTQLFQYPSNNPKLKFHRAIPDVKCRIILLHISCKYRSLKRPNVFKNLPALRISKIIEGRKVYVPISTSKVCRWGHGSLTAASHPLACLTVPYHPSISPQPIILLILHTSLTSKTVEFITSSALTIEEYEKHHCLHGWHFDVCEL